ncbi:MAG: D-alanine--D-alanine ligase, partial [Oscillospiraceae bacterium]
MSKTNKLNIGIVFGGVSSEYEISLLSATSVLKNIDKDIYNIFAIGISKTGEFSLYNGDYEKIATDNWQENQTECVPCVISPDRKHHGIILIGEKSEIVRLDCVFPVLHGKNGEDGTIQGLLELSSIPYVGCDVLSSACCMDKAVTKALLDNSKIKNAKWLFVLKSEYNEKKDSILK